MSIEPDQWRAAAELASSDFERMAVLYAALINTLFDLERRWNERNELFSDRADDYSRGARAVSAECRNELLTVIRFASETGIANAREMRAKKLVP